MTAGTRAADPGSGTGEAFGACRMDGAALLRAVASANVACGFHGGGREAMAEAFALAKARGVAVGAHPGFPERLELRRGDGGMGRGMECAR